MRASFGTGKKSVPPNSSIKLVLALRKKFRQLNRHARLADGPVFHRNRSGHSLSFDDAGLVTIVGAEKNDLETAANIVLRKLIRGQERQEVLGIVRADRPQAPRREIQAGFFVLNYHFHAPKRKNFRRGGVVVDWPVMKTDIRNLIQGLGTTTLWREPVLPEPRNLFPRLIVYGVSCRGIKTYENGAALLHP